MRKALLIIAFIFLSNPLISNVDVLPDLVGYILIMIMLSKHTYYDTAAKSAYKCTRNVALVSLAKLLSVYLSTMAVDDTVSLLFSFTFFTLELVFGIPFLLKIFEYSSHRALKIGNSGALKIADGVKIAAIVLFALRLLLATAPDFILLTAGDPLSSYHNDLSSFRPVLILLSVLLSSVITLVWIPLEAYFFAVAFNKREAEDARLELNERLSNKELQFNLSLQKKMLVLLSVLSIFVFEIRIDNIDIFFNSVLPLAFIAFYVFLIIKKYVKFDKIFFALLSVTILQLIFNIVVKLMTRSFFEEYSLASVLKISQAETKYFAILPFIIISQVLFSVSIALSMMLLIRSARGTLSEYIGTCLPSADREYTVAEFNKRSRLFFILPVASSLGMAVASPIVFAFMPRIDEMTKINLFGTVFNLPILPSLIPAQMLLTLGFVALFIYSLAMINDQVYKKLYYPISLD